MFTVEITAIGKVIEYDEKNQLLIVQVEGEPIATEACEIQVFETYKAGTKGSRRGWRSLHITPRGMLRLE